MIAQLFRFCELSWQDLTNIKRWFRCSEARDGFALGSLNPATRVAKATNGAGQTICLCPIEQCFVISALIRNPAATGPEMLQASNMLDAELARFAQREGVQRFLIALPPSHPPEPGERRVRVIERHVPQAVAMGGVACDKTTTVQVN